MVDFSINCFWNSNFQHSLKLYHWPCVQNTWSHKHHWKF